jgi:hypothetical protein
VVRWRVYLCTWPLVSNEGVRKFFDKLTVKPKSSESAAVVMDTPYHNELKRPAEAGNYVYIRHFRCVCLKVLSLFRRLPPFLLSQESMGVSTI